MVLKDTFCNTPWFEAHIYWDGSLGICCQESQKLTTDPKYNIANMSLLDWFNSEPVKQFRYGVALGSARTECSRCYSEEKYNNTSRRVRANQKSVIFTKTAFDKSYKQSPHYPVFQYSKETNGETYSYPVDLHIDLGNYCNLACRMCFPGASSTIATQYAKWGILDSARKQDWTSNVTVWERFLHDLLKIPNLKNIHFMGGETLLTRKFEDLVDFMILHKRFDLCFSFVSNGTVYNQHLLDKLKLFSRVGIEISIETITTQNDYIRLNSTVNKVINNIERYLSECNDTSITLTIRSAISLLSVGSYHTLLLYCLNNRLLIKSLLVETPKYLNVKVLPYSLRLQYLQEYIKLGQELKESDISIDFNESNVVNYKQSVQTQVQQVIALLSDSEQLNFKDEFVNWMIRWDEYSNLRLLDYYPEFNEWLNEKI